MCYRDGIGIEINPQKAFEYFKKSSDQGFKKAQYYLAVCYSLGLGTEQNKSLAFELFLNSSTNWMPILDAYIQTYPLLLIPVCFASVAAFYGTLWSIVKICECCNRDPQPRNRQPNNGLPPPNPIIKISGFIDNNDIYVMSQGTYIYLTPEKRKEYGCTLMVSHSPENILRDLTLKIHSETKLSDKDIINITNIKNNILKLCGTSDEKQIDVTKTPIEELLEEAKKTKTNIDQIENKYRCIISLHIPLMPVNFLGKEKCLYNLGNIVLYFIEKLPFQPLTPLHKSPDNNLFTIERAIDIEKEIIKAIKDKIKITIEITKTLGDIINKIEADTLTSSSSNHSSTSSSNASLIATHSAVFLSSSSSPSSTSTMSSASVQSNSTNIDTPSP